ncbi:RRP15-like protein [Hyperolius riggenbachi]|uniref:RRP15-like protein n=1 Tax=Hyperolius riggenbachi TaxID=752182 RepID=UPI0035A2DF2A
MESVEASVAAGSEDSSDFADDSFSSDNDVVQPGATKEKSEEESEPDGDQNKGWADAMAKILNKKVPSEKTTTILVKSKALEKEKERDRLEKLEKKQQVDKKRQWEMMCRVKPDVVRDREVERNLQRVATRGVVQLFNAVRTHQGKVSDKLKEAGGSERKRSKLMSSVSKRDFIDVLRGKESKSEQTEGRPSKKTSIGSSGFHVMSGLGCVLVVSLSIQLPITRLMSPFEEVTNLVSRSEGTISDLIPFTFFLERALQKVVDQAVDEHNQEKEESWAPSPSEPNLS